ncbi:MAG: hypothetical protein WAV76_04025 [Bacteroidota bacterium]
MGIYEILTGHSQTLKLTLIHQHNSTVHQKEHVEELQEFMKLVQQEAETKERAFAAHIEEITAKSVQALKGNLSEFLTTPLRSDLDEIQKHIIDHAKQLEKQYIIPSKINIYDVLLSRYSMDEVNDTKLKPLFASAKRLLKLSGFIDISDYRALYASDFIIGGTDTLSFLESILSDLLSFRLKALFADSVFSFRIYDLFHPAEYHHNQEARYAILIVIRNRGIDHSTATNNLHSWFDTIGAGSFTWFLWKKRLISGFDGETVLEIRVKDKAEMKHLFLLISNNLDLFKKMFSSKEASLFVKERLVL